MCAGTIRFLRRHLGITMAYRLVNIQANCHRCIAHTKDPRMIFCGKTLTGNYHYQYQDIFQIGKLPIFRI